MLPYRDNFKCERWKDAGVCNSVVEVYELSNDMDTLRIKASSDKNNTKEKEKITPTEVFLKQKDEKAMQEIINAISIKQIQNSTPIIFKINGDSLMIYSYETPNNQQVLEYLIKDNNAYTKRLKDESLNKASNDDSLRTLQDTSDKDNIFYASYEDIVEQLKVSKPTVVKTFRQLIDTGLLVRLKNKIYKLQPDISIYKDSP